MDDTRAPQSGIDYPRTFKEFEAWFVSEDACRNYLRRLRWPNGFVFPARGHRHQRQPRSNPRRDATRSQGRLAAQTMAHGHLLGGIQHQHLDYYLDEFAFRFNRRRSKARNMLFYCLAQQAVLIAPTPTIPSSTQTPAAPTVCHGRIGGEMVVFRFRGGSLQYFLTRHSLPTMKRRRTPHPG